MTQPFITQDIINQLFGENAKKVEKTFFDIKRHCGLDPQSPESNVIADLTHNPLNSGDSRFRGNDGLDGTCGLLVFKQEFENQVKLEQNFPAKEFSQDVLKNLMRLHCEVIFIKDFKQKNHFHPRISLPKSYTYNSLKYAERQALERLYNDYFFVRHEEFWKANAMKKLPTLVSATDMLVCGEDLGMVPASVPQVMDKLHILSLEIQRMPKDATQEFVNPYHTPYFSVCASGTHDMSPIRAWWHEDRALIQRFYNSMLHFDGIAPENCTPEIAEKIVSEQFRANSMFAILPLQDYFAMDSEIANPDFESERINVPENPKHFWCYRTHISLEQLLAAKKFNKKLKMCVEYNRG
jgi:4-alpha-glucanotransferase